MRLHDLRAPKGASKKRHRVGRGESSGWGKTSGTGGKGQTARTGKGKPGLGFEGGQMPMFRRMPKRGFVNIFAKEWAEVNLDVLVKHFQAGAVVTLDALRTAGLASRRMAGVRVLGRGDLGYALTVHADHFSATAKQKIEAAGGKALAAGAAGV
ncbi:MAG: 50S ribosomal protein L15 [Myxococcota bacterium]